MQKSGKTTLKTLYSGFGGFLANDNTHPWRPDRNHYDCSHVGQPHPGVDQCVITADTINMATEVDKTKQIDIAEWFDPHSISHLHGYRKLLTDGTWPEDLVPEHVTSTMGWPLRLAQKVAMIHIDLTLSQQRSVTHP